MGLVSGTCFADLGVNVTCVDRDSQKINRLVYGAIPICKPDFMTVLSDVQSCTYEYYQNNIKPKPQAVGQTPKGETIWRCTICGYEYVGEELPDDFICPICKHGSDDFEKVVR